jgi:hypothetical protein
LKRAGGPFWVMAAHALDVADLDGDGEEDVVGLCSDQLDGAASFCAFSLKRAEATLVWKFGTLNREQVHQAHVVALGDRVLLVDPGALARVVALADGKEHAAIQFDDRVRESCKPSEHPAGVWLRLADDSTFLVDMPKGTAAPEPRPRSCPPSDEQPWLCMKGMGGAGCKDMTLPAEVKNMLPLEVVYGGRWGVLLGMHTPGTSYAMIAGFEVGQTDTTFVRPLADGPPLQSPEGHPMAPIVISGDRVFAKHDDEVVAIGVQDGKTLWRAKPGASMTLRASEGRVYVGRWTALEIIDANDGQHIATIGMR